MFISAQMNKQAYTQDQINHLAGLFRSVGDVPVCKVCLTTRCVEEHEKVKIGELLILHHVPLALFLAKKKSKNPDAQATALLILVKTIRSPRVKKYCDNISGYINKCISKRLNTFFRENTLIRVPVASQWRHKIKEQEIESIDLHPDFVTAQDEMPEIELQDMIKALKLNLREAAILKLLLQGFNDSEIARKLGLHRETILISRHKVKEKYNVFSQKKSF